MPAALLAAGAPLVTGPTTFTIAAAAIAVLLLAVPEGGAVVTIGGLAVVAEVGVGATGTGWDLAVAAVSAMGLVMLAAPTRRLAGELTVGAGVAALIAVVPVAGPLTAVLAGLGAVVLLLVLLGTALPQPRR